MVREIRPTSTATASFQTALNIWVTRFRTAQQHIRLLENELAVLRQRYELALHLLTEEQLAELAGYNPTGGVQTTVFGPGGNNAQPRDDADGCGCG